MTIYIVLKPREVYPINFQIEMSYEDFQRLKAKGIADLIQAVEATEKFVVDRLLKKEVKNDAKTKP